MPPISPTIVWSLSFTASARLAERFAAVLEDEALALTIMAPPREPAAQVEALYHEKPDINALSARLAVVAVICGTRAPKLALHEIPANDWVRQVAGDFPPIKIGQWIVHGSAHREAVEDRRRALQIDAASAFGTGEHPTTRGCLLMLKNYLKKHPPPPQRYALGPLPLPLRGRGHARLLPSPASRERVSSIARRVRVLDIGCGTGILAMAAMQSLRGLAVAVDLDPDAVAITRGNIHINGLQNYIRPGLSRGTAARLVRHHAPYDLIMANIFAGPLSRMAHDIKRNLRPGGSVILAGMLNSQANRVLSAFRAQNMGLVCKLTIGEWAILWCRRNRLA